MVRVEEMFLIKEGKRMQTMSNGNRLFADARRVPVLSSGLVNFVFRAQAWVPMNLVPHSGIARLLGVQRMGAFLLPFPHSLSSKPDDQISSTDICKISRLLPVELS